MINVSDYKYTSLKFVDLFITQNTPVLENKLLSKTLFQFSATVS